MTFTFLPGSLSESATSQSHETGQSHGKEPQLRSDAQRAREYELMTIFAPDVPEEDLQGAIDRVSGLVTTAGGNVTLINRESPWGRRRLAYPIRHNSRDVRDGIYVLYYFECDPAQICDIERDLRLTDTVIRHMVAQQVAAPMAPPAPETEGAGKAEGTEEPAMSAESKTSASTGESEATTNTAESDVSAPTAGDEPAAAEPESETAAASTDETGEDTGTQS